MRIKGKEVYVYDIEVFPNCFHCSIKNVKSKERLHYEISSRKNDLLKLVSFFTNAVKDKCIVGYNCIHYDNPIINFIIAQYSVFKEWNYIQICDSIYSLSDLIIKSETSATWKKWKYATKFMTIDLLTMLFSEKLRVGLKELEVTMKFHNVREYEGDFTRPIPEKDIDDMIRYNDNDVDATEELLNRCIDALKLRLGIEKEYGLNVLSMDGVSIGKEILKTKYLKDTGKSWDEIKDLRSPCDMVSLKEVILEKMNYNDPFLQKLLDEMKTLTVNPGIDGWSKHFLFHNRELSIGVGGLHSINSSEKIIPASDEILIDVDAASLYPSLLIEYGFYPKHLGPEFVTTYSNIKKERIEAKHNGDKVKNETLKLALNSVTGLMQSEYSWMYSPKDVMRIRMNGQLFLLKLAEMLYEKLDCDIVNWNTDGLFVKLKKKDYPIYEEVIKKFEEFSLLSMETEEFEEMFQISVNDYIAVHKGYSESKDRKLIKQKGSLIETVTIGKGMQPTIIPRALTDYFVNGIPVEDTINNCTDYNEFITYQKVGKEFSVEYNNKIISRINRYYISNTGPYLFKCKIDPETGIRRQYTNMLKGYPVKIVNDFNEITEFPKDINYSYYIRECKKIINAFERIQLSLF